jgi:hypothetical protein
VQLRDLGPSEARPFSTRRPTNGLLRAGRPVVTKPIGPHRTIGPEYFQRCFQRMTLENDGFWKRVIFAMDFRTDPDGVVSRLCMRYAPAMPDTTACVADVIRRERFAPLFDGTYVLEMLTD